MALASRLVPCVLAAGASRRLGEPKALATIGDRTVLEILVRTLAMARMSERTIVVTGAHHAEIARFVDETMSTTGPGVEVVHNGAWQRGRSGSVAVGRDARAGCDILLAPVDVPLVEPATVTGLVAEWRRRGAPARGWLAPRLREGCGVSSCRTGRFGHPIVIGRGLLADLAGVDPGAPLSELRGSASPLWSLDVDDPGVMDDLDTPEDLAALRAAWRTRQRD